MSSQDLLKKIHQFQQDVWHEVNVELMDLSRLETLHDEFTSPPDIDIPELTLLKKVKGPSLIQRHKLQLRWRLASQTEQAGRL